VTEGVVDSLQIVEINKGYGERRSGSIGTDSIIPRLGDTAVRGENESSLGTSIDHDADRRRVA